MKTMLPLAVQQRILIYRFYASGLLSLKSLYDLKKDNRPDQLIRKLSTLRTLNSFHSFLRFYLKIMNKEELLEVSVEKLATYQLQQKDLRNKKYV
jgi:hypothetical protein